MIERLTVENTIDIITFLSDNKDRFEDFYFTLNKERIFLNNNRELIKKLLKTQECYGIFDKGLKGILIIYRSKGFRPYLKLLTVDIESINKLMKFFVWNKNEIDIFCKVKIDNPIANVIKRFGFFLKGNRGKEVLFFKQGFKTINPLVPKDVYLPKEELRLY